MPVEQLLGRLPRGWNYTTLAEACAEAGGNLQTGPFGNQLHAYDYVANGLPTIMPQNIGENRVVEEGIARISEEDAERLGRYRVQPGDIVYSRRGDVERRALIRQHEDGWLCGTGCLRVRFGAGFVDPVYASYYLGDPRVCEWVVRHAHGATMPNLNTAILSALPFVVPPLSEQRAIARVLSMLDDKIELNRRMNTTLGAIAQALFKSWFVDFDPVHAKAKGRDPGLPKHLAALFPDSLENSGLRESPHGWRHGTLGEIAENPRRVVQPSRLDPGAPYIGLGHMPQRSIILSKWGRAEDLESSKFEFEEGEILFGKLRPYFHKVGLAPVDGVCSTDILVVRPKDSTWLGFVLGHVTSDKFIAYTDSGSTGTRMPRTTWQEMARYELILPPKQVVAEYNDYLKVLTKRISVNIHEARTLVSVHEALLPKLMSGELLIRDAERFSGGRT
jgi:type I restriction enzyme, S subunit